MRRSAPRYSGTPRTLFRGGIAALLAFVLAITSMVGLSNTAHAATPGITANLLLNDTEVYDGTPVVNEGDVLNLKVQYSQPAAGESVVFTVDPSVTITGAPSTNTAVSSVVQEGDKVTVTFRPIADWDVDQGVLDFYFTVNAVDSSKHDKITYIIDGDPTSLDVIVRNTDDQFENVSESFSKSVWPTNLDSLVQVVGSDVSLKQPEATDQVITYTLWINSPTARTAFPVVDTLPAGLSYVDGSFAHEVTTWDADGLNRTTAPAQAFTPTVTDNSFTWNANLPGPSVTKVTYQVKITDAAAIEALLQAEYAKLTAGYGQFQTSVANTATFGGPDTERTASIRFRHTIANPNPGPSLGDAFSKTASWSTKNVVTDEAGTLTPPAEIVYTLGANLAGWDNSNPNKVLNHNVVITDTLPSQASWMSSDDEFITATGIELAAASPAPADADAFADDSYVGTYWLDGQTLRVNVGKNNATQASIQVKAQLNTVEGLTVAGTTTIDDAVPYRWRNTASYKYSEGGPHRINRDVTVVRLPSTDGGLNDSSVFTKSGEADASEVDPGDTVTVDYTFSVAAGKGVDVRESYIVDYLDTEMFDLEDPNTLVISGRYDGQALDADDFSLSTDTDGNLIIKLSDDGTAIVDTRGADKTYVVNIELTTVPFVGKETRTITNRAVLFGEDDDPQYWSETSSEATSYGDEAEVRKRVYDRAESDWVETVNAEIDANGDLVQPTYVYRIEFIPHGSYNAVKIVDVNDILPPTVDFLGFVTEENADDASAPVVGPVDIGGNLEAVYNHTAHTVTLRQKDDTVLQAGSPIAAYVAVTVNNAEAQVVNVVSGSEAKIVPVPSVSVGDFVWVDTDRDGIQDTGEPGIPNVVLDLVGPDGEPVTNIFGKPVAPVTTDADGKYTFTQLPVLTGTETYTVKIDRDASEEALRPYVPTITGAGDRATDSSEWEASTTPGDLQKNARRDPTLDFGFVVPSVSVGNYVWEDVNRDGLQDATDTPIPGVVLTLTGPDGEPVTDVLGNVVGPETTDGTGHYLFPNLPVLTGEDQYTVTIDQTASAEALRPFMPTTPNVGDDRAVDSSTWVAQSAVGELSEHENEDLTLDFGFVKKSVSVGDYVWEDVNRDGIQDEGESGIEDVVLRIVGPDGESVTDIHGNEVAPTTTDENGWYSFTDLPTLTEDQVYTVIIVADHESTEEALAPFVPTIENPEAGRANDSSTWTAKTEEGDLTEHEDQDMTLDFGFVRKMVSVGDYVWEDVNRDGLQDDTDKPIAGVVLTIVGPNGEAVTDVYGEPVGPQTTDATGYYSFDGLPALTGEQTYTVRIDQATNAEVLRPFIPTLDEEGDDRSQDSSTWEANTVAGELQANEERDPTLDFGFVKKRVSVGDYVWEDVNRDGIQDEDEPGIPGVTVKIVGPNDEPVTDVFGNPVEPQVTDGEGKYDFPDLPALFDDETYKVVIDYEESEEVLRPYLPTREGEGDDPSRDSSTDEAETTPGTLDTDGDRDPTLDFGFVKKRVSVGDYVWEDVNRDGIQDEGEPGIPGVVITLVGPDSEPVTDVYGNPVEPQTTDEDGRYWFDNLPALLDEDETYTVVIDQEASEAALRPYLPTIENEEAGRDQDSSLWEASTLPAELSEDGAEDPTLDFGFVKKVVSVGDYVWVDENRDGVQDEGEPGIPGVVVKIVDPNGEPVTDVYGNPVAPQTTDEDGKYDFPNLPALDGEQTYTVIIDRETSEDALRPYVPTIEGAGDRATDSSTWNASTEPGDLHEDGMRDSTLDFGFVKKTYAIGDLVWIDENRNGLQDDDEDVLAGVTVELLVDGTVIATTTTDEDGRYVFDNLEAGEYQVRFTLTDEQAQRYEFTTQDAGDDARDSDADPANGFTITIVLDDSNASLTTDYAYRTIGASQGIDPTWDAGVVWKLTPEKKPQTMPNTGSTVGVAAMIGAVLLVGVGGVLLYLNRIRRTA